MREKTDSPFYPQKPLPAEKFFGRDDLVREIWKKDLQPVWNHRRTQMVWLSGERGIGKSSLANFLLDKAEKEGLLSLRINLSRVHTVNDLIENIIYKILEYQEKTKEPISKFIKNNFKKYIEEVEVPTLFGGLKVKIKEEEIKKDIPEYKRNFEDFLKTFIAAVKQNSKDYLGIFLLLDEINGLAEAPEFANFLKGLSDTLDTHSSLLFMICGTEEKRQAIIRNHESTNRIFNLYNLSPIKKEDFAQYFMREFENCEIKIQEPEYAHLMALFSEGQPRFAQIIGDNIFYIDEDFIIDQNDIHQGIIKSIDDIGEKFIKPLYEEIKSQKYKVLIKKITEIIDKEGKNSFTREEICKNLDKKEKQNFDRFIKRMKDLGFVKSEVKDSGEYKFKDFFTRAYLGLLSRKESYHIKSVEEQKV